jgi:hypothetical protein
VQLVSECPICDKHRGEGSLAGEVLYEDEYVLVSHAPVGTVDGYLGYLFVDRSDTFAVWPISRRRRRVLWR